MSSLPILIATLAGFEAAATLLAREPVALWKTVVLFAVGAPFIAVLAYCWVFLFTARLRKVRPVPWKRVRVEYFAVLAVIWLLLALNRS